MVFLLMAILGLVLGWLAWMLAGVRGMNLIVYLTFGLFGSLSGMLLMRYLAGSVEGQISSVITASLCAVVTLFLIVSFDRHYA